MEAVAVSDAVTQLNLLGEIAPQSALAFGAIAVVSYFLGCSNGAVIISKYILRDDIRTHGSGNAGLTNFYRTFGGGITLAVILIDVLKMLLSLVAGVLIARHFLFGPAAEPWMSLLAKYWAGTFCILGHMFPCMFGFKGGKGILSGGTMVLMMDWRIALVAWGGFVLLVALTRWVSLGSCWAAASFPVSTFFVFHNPVLTVLALISGGLVVWKHRGNIQRILKGTESKFSFHHKKDS